VTVVCPGRNRRKDALYMNYSPLVTVFVVVVRVRAIVVVLFGRRRVGTVAELPEDVRGHVVVCRRVGQLIFGAFAQHVLGLGR